MTGGGSGCSNLAVPLTENGPCRINEDATTALNPHSWTSEANVILLDQPTNVGFSYDNSSGTVLNEKEVQENMYWFLQGFLDKHPEFEGRALYLAGEGYAAHYVPAAAHYIWSENLAVKKENATLRINLQGIIIGNGLVNPVVQMPHVLNMATKNSYNINLLKPTDVTTAKEAAPVCNQLMDVCQTNSSACPGASRYCSSALLDVMDGSRRNKFDIRKECDSGDPTRCYNSSAVIQYLNSNTVRTYLNVSDEVPPLEQCSSLNRKLYSTDLMKNFDGYIADLLNNGDVRVLIYSGDADLVCNWRGSEAWTKQLKWKYYQAFNDVEEQDFLMAGEVDTTVAGSIRSSNQFTSFVYSRLVTWLQGSTSNRS
ncbi:hypothetical protein V7S43_007540 [Phytophthora oleae]|uniref:Carboxypeptidase n=1 Tax=Phytophthora oleae TaxID=2107226 RepID=A0ABD3FLI0_9STRA